MEAGARGTTSVAERLRRGPKGPVGTATSRVAGVRLFHRLADFLDRLEAHSVYGMAGRRTLDVGLQRLQAWWSESESEPKTPRRPATPRQSARAVLPGPILAVTRRERAPSPERGRSRSRHKKEDRAANREHRDRKEKDRKADKDRKDRKADKEVARPSKRERPRSDSDADDPDDLLRRLQKAVGKKGKASSRSSYAVWKIPAGAAITGSSFTMPECTTGMSGHVTTVIDLTSEAMAIDVMSAGITPASGLAVIDSGASDTVGSPEALQAIAVRLRSVDPASSIQVDVDAGKRVRF